MPNAPLLSLPQAALGAPDGTVRSVVFPTVAGGEQTLRELVHEFKANGPLYRRTVQTTLKASYTNRDALRCSRSWSGCQLAVLDNPQNPCSADSSRGPDHRGRNCFMHDRG